MPIPIALAAALAPSLYKSFKGLLQGDEADNVKLRDTTPAAFKEALALGRQATAAEMPGTGAQLNRIEAGTNSTLAAGARAGTSSSSLLGLLEQTDANRTRYLADLSTKQDAFHQQKEHDLTGLLGRQAQYQAHDLDTFDRNRAALSEASSRNLYGGVDGVSQVLAQYLNQSGDDESKDKSKNKSLLPAGASGVATPGAGQPKRTSYNKWGIYDPTGSFYG